MSYVLLTTIKIIYYYNVFKGPSGQDVTFSLEEERDKSFYVDTVALLQAFFFVFYVLHFDNNRGQNQTQKKIGSLSQYILRIVHDCA